MNQFYYKFLLEFWKITKMGLPQDPVQQHHMWALTNKYASIFSKPPDFGWSAMSEASHGTPEGGLFKKTAK